MSRRLGVRLASKVQDRRTDRNDYKLADERFYGPNVAMPDDLDIDESRMSLWVNFADGNSRDGVGDLLEVTGIDTSRHRKNPLILFDHGKVVKLPVAKAEDPDTQAYTVFVDPVARTARAKAFFYRGKDSEHALFCEQLFDLVVKKYVRGGSIGYHTVEADHLPPYNFAPDGSPVGQHLKKILMLECSVVVLPCNQDTVRKCLAMPRICGKAPSPYLVKSLAPYAGATSATVAVPRDVRKGPKVPPAEWRPGAGAVKGANPGEVEPMVPNCPHCGSDETVFSQLEGKAECYACEKDFDVEPAPGDGKGLTRWRVKGSYFDNCPRDETGHCKPRGTDNMAGSGGGAATEKRPKAKPEEDKFRRDRDKQGSLGAPDEVGPFRVVVKEGNQWFVIHTRDDEWPADGPYEDRGEAQAVADQLNQQYLSGDPVDPSAAVGGEADETMATQGQALEDVESSMEGTGAPPGENDLPDDDPPDDLGDVPPEQAGGAGVTEKYGAQCLRQLHSDFSILMEDYDEMVELLEQQEVKDSVVKILVHMADSLSQLEQLFFSVYPEIQDQLGAAGVTMPGGVGNDDQLGEDENQDADMMEDPAVGADSDEPEVPTPEEAAEGMRRDNNKSLDAVRAKYKSATVCAACGRADCPCAGKKGCKCSYKGKADGGEKKKAKADVSEAEGKEPGGKEPESTDSDTPTPETDKEGGADPWGDFADHERNYVREGHGFLGELAVAKEFMDEHRMKSYHYHKVFDAIGSFDPMAAAGETLGAAADANRQNIVRGMGGDPGTSEPPTPSGDADPEDEAGKSKGGKKDKGMPGDPEADEPGDPEAYPTQGGDKDCGMKLPHLRKSCKEISEHFKGLAFSRDPYGDAHRAKATHYYKMLEPLFGGGTGGNVQSPDYKPAGPTGETANPKPEEEVLEDPEQVKALRDVLTKQIEAQDALSRKLAALLG